MKIRIEKSRLVDAMRRLQPVVGGANSLQVVRCICIETAEEGAVMRATDLDLGLVHPCVCAVDEPGGACINAKALAAIASRLPDGEPVVVETDGDQTVVIRGGTVRYRMGCFPVADFPKSFPPDPAAPRVEIAASSLRSILARAARCVSRDPTRRSITGVCLSVRDGTAQAVATDGVALAAAECDVASASATASLAETILPARAANEAVRLLDRVDGDVGLVLEAHSAVHVDLGGGAMLRTKVLDEVYPNWRAVVPSPNGRIDVAVDADALSAAVERVSIVCATDSCSSVALRFAGNALTVTGGAEGSGLAKDEIAVKYDGDECGLRVSYERLLAHLRSVSPGDVRLVFDMLPANVERTPLLLSAAGYTGVLMPVRPN